MYEDESPVTLEANILLAAFSEVFPKQGKATNIPKFLVRIFYNDMKILIDQIIPESADKKPHLNWL